MSRFGKPEKTTEHHYLEERLSAYLDGELLPQERDAVEHHLSTCQHCQWNLDTLSKTVQWTRELPTVPVPRVFTIQVPATPQRAVQRRWSFVPALQAATAVVALLLFFTVTGDFLLGGFRMAGAPEPMLMEQQLPVVVEATQVVEAPREAPPAATEAAAALVVETIVVEAEQPVEAQAEKLVVQPTPSPLTTYAPEPASPEEGEAAPDEAPSAPGIGGPEGESQADELGLGGAAPPTEVMEVPAAAGGELESRALTAPAEEAAQPTTVAAEPTVQAEAQPTTLAAAEVQEQQAEDRATERAAEQAQARAVRQPIHLGLRLIEYGLGVLLLLLATSTIVVMVQRRRAR